MVGIERREDEQLVHAWRLPGSVLHFHGIAQLVLVGPDFPCSLEPQNLVS